MTNKCYLDAQALLEDSWRLGAMMTQDGFVPDFIVAIWRGGVPVGIAVQEFLVIRLTAELTNLFQLCGA